MMAGFAAVGTLLKLLLEKAGLLLQGLFDPWMHCRRIKSQQLVAG
jgi:hypothetical protein